MNNINYFRTLLKMIWHIFPYAVKPVNHLGSRIKILPNKQKKILEMYLFFSFFLGCCLKLCSSKLKRSNKPWHLRDTGFKKWLPLPKKQEKFQLLSHKLAVQDTHRCMAEFLCCPPETITTLLTGYTTTANKS